jgi:HSP20 family molecular chaperone IbpA
MGFFDNGEDPFEDIVREFFGDSGTRIRPGEKRIIRGEKEDRQIDFINTGEKIYFIFEMPGYEKKDVEIKVEGNELIVNTNKRTTEKVQDYLFRKLERGLSFKKNLPRGIRKKNYKSSLKNGVLEIIFEKK